MFLRLLLQFLYLRHLIEYGKEDEEENATGHRIVRHGHTEGGEAEVADEKDHKEEACKDAQIGGKATVVVVHAHHGHKDSSKAHSTGNAAQHTVLVGIGHSIGQIAQQSGEADADEQKNDIGFHGLKFYG